MIHSFETRIAQEVGLNSAVILNNLYYWIEKNRANNKNFYDGYYWTYNSRKAFTELFPYFTSRQIEHAIQKLIDAQLVITGSYNDSPYDRTLWYAITQKGYDLLTGKTTESPKECISQNCEIEEQIPVECISQNCEIDKQKMLNGETKNVKCIIGSNSKPNSKQKSKKERDNAKSENQSFDSLIDDYSENEELRSELKEHLKTRKSKKAAMTNRAIELSLEKLDKLSNNDAEKIQIVQNAIMNGWTTFYPLKDEQSSKITTGNSPRKNYDFGLSANYDLGMYESNYRYI